MNGYNNIPDMDSREFSESLQKAYQEALQEADKIGAQARELLRAAAEEREAAAAIHRAAAQEAESLVAAYYQDRQREFSEAARTALLRQLVRHHLENGETAEDITKWLQVPMDVIQQLKDYLQRLSAFNASREPNLPGNPRLHYKDEGRSGTITFINDQTQFEMWWEYGGDDALVIVSIPDENRWTATTGLGLEEREPVLHFIGQQVVKDRLSGAGVFHVGASVITFYR
jgi:hypothetical protein